jgi:hypothetical protein
MDTLVRHNQSVREDIVLVDQIILMASVSMVILEVIVRIILIVILGIVI